MAKTSSDYTVTFHADTSELDREIERLRFKLWWYRNARWVLLALCLVLVTLGIGVGLMIGLLL